MNNKFFSFLGLAKRAGKVLEGYNKCQDALGKKPLYLFIISTDISERTNKLFMDYCVKNNIKYIKDFTKEELGNSLGRSEINIIGINDKNIADKLLVNYNEIKQQ